MNRRAAPLTSNYERDTIPRRRNSRCQRPRIDAVQHCIAFNHTLSGLTRFRDPYAKDMLENLVSRQTSKPGKPFHWTLSRKELTDLAHRYGEQYVEDPCADLDQYFDIINNRWPAQALFVDSAN